jgi:hypothetical protein
VVKASLLDRCTCIITAAALLSEVQRALEQERRVLKLYY